MGKFKPRLLLDLGAGWIKYAEAGQEDSAARIPAVLGFPKVPLADFQEQFLCGPPLVSSRGRFLLQFVLEHAGKKVLDKDSLAWVLNEVFARVAASSPETPVMVIVPDYVLPENFELLKVVFFDKLRVPQLLVVPESELLLKHAKQSAGVIVDVGFSRTRVTPYLDYDVIKKSATSSRFAGESLSRYLLELLKRRYNFLESITNLLEIETVKERYCHLVADFGAALARPLAELDLAVTHELAGKYAIDLGIEQFLVPEALFTPEILGKTEESLFTQIARAVQACPLHVRKAVFQNLYLVGGTLAVPGFTDRLKTILERIPILANANLVTFPAPQYAYLDVARELLATKKFPFEDAVLSPKQFEKERRYYPQYNE